MRNETSIRTWQEKFQNGDFDNVDRDTQIKAGWYDWFCSDSELLGRLKNLSKPILQLTDSKKVNLDTMYVWFKNNCPVSHPTYDDFRIADIETGGVQYTVAYKEPYDKEKNMWNVYAICEDNVVDENGREHLKSYQFKDTKSLVEWFNK